MADGLNFTLNYNNFYINYLAKGFLSHSKVSNLVSPLIIAFFIYDYNIPSNGIDSLNKKCVNTPIAHISDFNPYFPYIISGD